MVLMSDFIDINYLIIVTNIDIKVLNNLIMIYLEISGMDYKGYINYLDIKTCISKARRKHIPKQLKP